MEKAKELLRIHEGLRLKPYRCTAGKLTIGYGINLDAGITKEEAEYLLDNRVNKIKNELSSKLSFFSDLSENRQAVLIDMAFNLGMAGLLAFQNTLKFIEQKEYVQASKAMLKSKWAAQVGQRAITLSELMRKG